MGLGCGVRIPCWPQFSQSVDHFEDALEDAFEIDERVLESITPELFDQFKAGDYFNFAPASAPDVKKLSEIEIENGDISLEKANKLFDECINWFADGHIVKAYNLSSSILEQVCDRKKFRVMWEPQIERINVAMEKFKETFHAAVLDEEHYTIAYQKDPKIMYRHHRGTRVHSLKVQACYDFRSDEVLAMGREFDYMATWNPFARDPRVVREEGDLSFTIYTGIWLPWPFTEREIVTRCEIADMVDEHGCYVFKLEDVEKEESFNQSQKKRERISMLPGSGALLYPDEDKTRILIVHHVVDPLIIAPPNWLINFVLSMMAPAVHRALQNALFKAYMLTDKSSKSPYAQKLTERDLYKKMQSRKSNKSSSCWLKGTHVI